MLLSKFFGIFSTCIFLIVIDVSAISDTKENKTLQGIIVYLNGNPNSSYIYEEGQYISSEIKADILQLTINVNVTCKIKHPEVPCTNTTLTCVVFLRQTSFQNNSDILSASCRHMDDISMEKSKEVDSTPQAAENLHQFDLSHEVYTENKAEFIAIKKSTGSCVGCPFDMDLEVAGISTLIDTALEHVEREYSQKYALVKVIRLQQQVTSGLKYILLLEIAPTLCSKVNNTQSCHIDYAKETTICEIIYLEKPWLNDAKNIIKNNCTISQEYNIESTPRTMPHNNEKYISKDFLMELESQIIPTMSKKNNFEISSIRSQISRRKNEVIQSVNRVTENILSEPSSVKHIGDISKVEGKYVFQIPVNVSRKFETTTGKSEMSYSTLDSFTSTMINNEEANSLNNNADKHTIINISRTRRQVEGQNDTLEDGWNKIIEESSSLENSNSNEVDDNNGSIFPSPCSPPIKFYEINCTQQQLQQQKKIKRKKNHVMSSTSESNNGDSKSISFSKDSTSSSMDSKGSFEEQDKRKFISNDNISSASTGDSSSFSKISAETINKCNQQTEKIDSVGNTLSDNTMSTKENSLSRKDDKSGKKKQIGSSHRISLSSDVDNHSENNESESIKQQLIYQRTDFICKSGSSSDSSENNSDIDLSSIISNDDSNCNRNNRQLLVHRRFIRSDGNSKFSSGLETSESKYDSGIESNSYSDSVLDSVPDGWSRMKRSDSSDSSDNGSSDNSDSNPEINNGLLSSESKTESDSKSNRHSNGDLKKYVLKRSHDPNNEPKSDFDSNFDSDSIVNKNKDLYTKISIRSKSSRSDARNYAKKSREKSSPKSANSHSNSQRLTKIAKDELANGIGEQPVVTLNRRKRLVGIWNDFFENDIQQIKKLANFAGKKLGANKSKMHIVSIQKLNLDDVYYRMNLKFGNKSCVIIMSLVHNSDIKIQNANCKDVQSTEMKIYPSYTTTNNAVYQKKGNSMSNGMVLLNNTKDIKQYLYEGLKFLDSQSPHLNKYKIQQILSSSSHIATGQIKVTAKVILSECRKESKLPLEECGDIENAESIICHFIEWEPKDHMNVTCEDKTNRVKRYISIAQEDELETIDFVNQELFENFIETYRKKYLNKIELHHRFKIFQNNLNTIRVLNKFEQGTATYGITKFMDLTREEFSKRHGLRRELQSENDISFSQANIPKIVLPMEFDWRKRNTVTEVKDQGNCGSCWAFSTTGNVEGQYAIKYNKLLQFSEQELVDCDNLDDGCNGGLMENAYRAIEKLGGLETEQEYPYDARGETCKFKKNKIEVKISGALNISHNETDMAKWLVHNGPISIAINANAMQFYVGGVSHPWKILCNPKNLDHGVLIVGYGVHTYPQFNKTLPFWIIKNSWGPNWGEQGYYRVYRGDGTCGLNETPSSSIVV